MFRHVLDAGYIGTPKCRILYAVDFYFDESGTHSGAPAFVVAGYLATSAQWLTFEERWLTARHDFGLSDFHMHDLEHRSVQFKGWNAKTAISLQSRLIQIINQTVMFGISCGLSADDYQAATPAPWHQNIRFAYLLCFYECLIGVGHYMGGTHSGADALRAGTFHLRPAPGV